MLSETAPTPDTEQNVLVKLGPGSLASSAEPVSPKPKKLRDLVELYMKTKLPRHLHPSYQAIRQIESSGERPALPGPSQSEPILKPITLHSNDHHDRHNSVNDPSTRQIYREAEQKTLSFKESLKIYENNADERYKTEVTLEGVNHTWQEVLDEVNSIVDEYKDKSGFWAKVGRGLRRFGEKSENLNGWLDLLPSDSEYFSIICGGLKLIIKAAARLRDVRETVFDAIASIPSHLTTTRLVVGVFKRSKQLQEASAALYVATLTALDHIVTWFREHAAKKFLRAFWQQDGYEKTLMQKVTAIKTSSENFAKVAQICSYQKQEDILNDVRQTKTDVHANGLAIERSRSESAQNLDSLNASMLLEASKNQDSFAELITQVSSNTLLVQNMDEILKRFFTADGRINQVTHDFREPPIPSPSLSPRAARSEKLREEALNHLDYEPPILQKDIQSLLRTAWRFPMLAQDRAVTLMKLPQLHDWLRDPFSSILFVNGNHDTSARQSPLSFVAAKLMDSLEPLERPQHAKRIRAHAFFCGQHLSTSDRDNGVSGLMRSLVAQLVVCFNDKFERSTMQELVKADSTDVQALCEIYYDLIAQLPSYITVFCLIDALSFHEDNKKRCKDAQRVMKVFDDLVNITDQSEHCVFKALLTCPGASRHLYKGVGQKKNVVWMLKNISPQGGFTSMKWKTSAGSEIGVLNAVNSF